jgi:hypothetical protein
MASAAFHVMNASLKHRRYGAPMHEDHEGLRTVMSACIAQASLSPR